MTWLYTLLISGLLAASSPEAPDAARNLSSSDYTVTYTKTIDKDYCEKSLDEVETFENTYPLNKNGRVRLSNINGSVKIEGWDRDEVHLVAKKSASSREILQRVDIQVNANPDFLEIKTEIKDKQNQNNNSINAISGNLSVDYTLQIPKTAIVNEISNVNGDITLKNLTSLVKVSAVNGSIMATQLEGETSLSLVSGKIQTEYTNLSKVSQIKLNTVNGNIELSLPSDADATLRAATLNGKILNNFGLPVIRSSFIGSSLYAKLGSGTVSIKLDSVNGLLDIKRLQDGKPLSKITNLNQPQDLERFVKIEPPKVDIPKIVIPKVEVRPIVVPDLSREISEATKQSLKASIESQMAALKSALNAHKASLRTFNKTKAKSLENQLKELENLKLEEINLETYKKIQEEIRKAVRLYQSDFGPAFSGTRRIIRTENRIKTGESPVLEVEAPDTNIQVTGWNFNEIKYSLVGYASEADSEKPQIKESVSENKVTLAVTDDSSLEYNSTRLEIFVPVKTSLVIKSAGSIRIIGLKGSTRIGSQTSSVEIRSCEGSLAIEGDSSDISIIGFYGPLSLRLDDCDLILDGNFTSIDAVANDSSIYFTIPENANFRFTAPADWLDGQEGLPEESSIFSKVFGSGSGQYTFNGSDSTLRLITSKELFAVN